MLQGRIVTIDKFTGWTDSVSRIVAWSVRGWTDCQGTVVYTSKINHERDVHCAFILGLLYCISTDANIPTMFFFSFLKNLPRLLINSLKCVIFDRGDIPSF